MNLKRLICLLCLIGILFSLPACQTNDPNTDDSGDTTSEVTGASDIESIDYKTLERRTAKSIKNVNFGFKTDNIMLTLPFSSEWTLSGNMTNGYVILRDGVEIGYLNSTEEDFSDDLTVKEAESTSDGLVVCERSLLVDPSATTVEKRFLQRFVYTYTAGATERTVTLQVGYTETDDFLSRKLLYIQNPSRISESIQMGEMMMPEPARKPILILGNSFIGSSKVGRILQDMCNANIRDNYEVIAISVGYATVSKSWSGYLDSMENGEYAAVIMCGFYGTGDVNAFGDYVEACKQSNTPIAIFPAHNESQGANAARKYPSVHYINWKGEIDALIKSGISKDDFCENDTHQHSTPLAGYVGAHMLWRVLFNEMPPVLDSYASLSYTEIKEKLGDYVENGLQVDDTEVNINYLH